MAMKMANQGRRQLGARSGMSAKKAPRVGLGLPQALAQLTKQQEPTGERSTSCDVLLSALAIAVLMVLFVVVGALV
jgi:hypothetical protein